MTLPTLNSEQTARAEALRHAAEVLATHDSDGNRRTVDAVDVVAVAGWIVDGRDPWPPQQVTVEATPEADQ